MPSGFQVFDPNGNLMLDITDRLARIIGAIGISTSSSYADDRFLQGEPFVAFQPSRVFGFINNDVSRPIFSFVGNVMSWQYAPIQTANGIYMPGVAFFGVR